MSDTPSIPPIVNKTMKLILRSPMHGVVSKSMLLISFTGRKSGKTYTTPVGLLAGRRPGDDFHSRQLVEEPAAVERR